MLCAVLWIGNTTNLLLKLHQLAIIADRGRPFPGISPERCGFPLPRSRHMELRSVGWSYLTLLRCGISLLSKTSPKEQYSQ
jgi:hypothetical protein